MSVHLYTGQTAAVLDTTEPILNDLIRRRKIAPMPAVVAGRRLWTREHVLAAARALGASEAAVLAKLEEAVRRGI